MKHVTLSCRLLYIRPCIPFHRTQIRYFSTDKADPGKPSGAVEPTEPNVSTGPTNHSPVDSSNLSPSEPSNHSPGESIKPSPEEVPKTSSVDKIEPSSPVESVKPSREAELHLDSKVEEKLSNAEVKKMLDIDFKDLQNKYMPKPMSFEDAREAAQKAIALQKRHLEDRMDSIRAIFSGRPDTPRTPDEEWYYKRVSFWMKRYENFVGLTEVKAAQARVVEAEKSFIQMQEKRREAQQNITEVSKRIKDIHVELEKTHRGEDRYLVLVTQEHNVLKEERNYLDEFKFFEKAEREYFSALSNAVRDSHEKERAQAEKTKYWSVLGSIIGTCLGILGTTINNRMRMNELRQLVARNSTVEEIQAIGEELTSSLDQHEKELNSLTVQVQGILNQAKVSLGNLHKMDGVLEALKESGDKINTRFLEETLAALQTRQEQLAQLIGQHEQTLNEKIEAIKSDIFVQSTNVGKLAHIQLKDRERDQKVGADRETFVKKSFDFLNKQNLDLQHSMNSFSKEIDEKIKDVRSLLLVEHRIPKLESKILDRLISLETSQQKLLKAGHASSAGRVANQDNLAAMLEAHHQRTRQTVILSTLMIAVLTPVAVYAANHAL